MVQQNLGIPKSNTNQINCLYLQKHLWNYRYRLYQESKRERKSISRGFDIWMSRKHLVLSQSTLKTYLARGNPKRRGVRVTHSLLSPSMQMITLPAPGWWSQRFRYWSTAWVPPQQTVRTHILTFLHCYGSRICKEIHQCEGGETANEDPSQI